LASNQRFISGGLEEAVIWPNGSESLQIEAAVDLLQKKRYEITDSDVRSRAKPAYEHSMNNYG